MQNMKKYANLVKRHARSLKTAGLYKTASDAASLLDHPIFGYPTGDKVDSYTLQSRAKIREEMYDILCAALAKSSVPLPPLEPEFYECMLKEKAEEKHEAEAKRIAAHIGAENGAGSTGSAALRSSIAAIIAAFPDCMGDFSRLDKRTLVAKLNQSLIADGREPVRPDYSGWKQNGASEMAAPPKPVRIAVLDDDTADLAKTLRRLVGWTKATLVPIKYERPGYGSPKQDRAARMEKAVCAVLDAKPDVVLMDQGLDNDFEGSDIIPLIREKAPNIRFVANTGGTDEKQSAVGAYPNCNKGEKLHPIARAIEALN